MGIKESFEEAKKTFEILDNDEAEKACHFVARLLEIEIERLERDEPYAIITITELQNAERKAWHIFDEIQELIEGEDSN